MCFLNRNIIAKKVHASSLEVNNNDVKLTTIMIVHKCIQRSNAPFMDEGPFPKFSEITF